LLIAAPATTPTNVVTTAPADAATEPHKADISGPLRSAADKELPLVARGVDEGHLAHGNPVLPAGGSTMVFRWSIHAHRRCSPTFWRTHGRTT
jgi:hypothetical protein